uniref:Uncharacterized protein n=1 Tax=Rhizophora mucronata TaxID=61149 RepID=A0A2P2N7I7_RHIMU
MYQLDLSPLEQIRKSSGKSKH